MTKWNPKTIAWWHEHLADWMLANPDRNLSEAARLFDCSVNYIYMLKNSDSFKAYWELRRKQHEAALQGKVVDAVTSFTEKLSAVADMSLDQLMGQLEKNATAQQVGPALIPLDELRATADLALKKLGYGITPAGGPGGNNTQVNVTINANVLEAAREKMRKLHGVDVALPGEVVMLEAKDESNDKDA